ncbi:hypothetical protein [Acrocarpospora sp. B8E8]
MSALRSAVKTVRWLANGCPKGKRRMTEQAVPDAHLAYELPNQSNGDDQ